jgi:hypothetical protein
MHPEARSLQEQLHNLYTRHRGLVGFIDESYRSDRDEGFLFYTITSTIVDVQDLAEFREDYFKVAGGHRWHTTDAFSRGDKGRIKDFISLLADHGSDLVVSVQVAIQDGKIEHARRECLVQTVSRLDSLGCNLVVYERREDRKSRNADAALFSRAVRDGLIPRNVKTFPGTPSAEKLLWGPDLAGWAMRRYVAMNETEWIQPLINQWEVIDASLGLDLRKKGPKPAAAMGSGPDSSVGLRGEEMNRSSLGSITRFGATEKSIFEIFPKTSAPVHDPNQLGAWLSEEFER